MTRTVDTVQNTEQLHQELVTKGLDSLVRDDLEYDSPRADLYMGVSSPEEVVALSDALFLRYIHPYYRQEKFDEVMSPVHDAILDRLTQAQEDPEYLGAASKRWSEAITEAIDAGHGKGLVESDSIVSIQNISSSPERLARGGFVSKLELGALDKAQYLQALAIINFPENGWDGAGSKSISATDKTFKLAVASLNGMATSQRGVSFVESGLENAQMKPIGRADNPLGQYIDSWAEASYASSALNILSYIGSMPAEDREHIRQELIAKIESEHVPEVRILSWELLGPNQMFARIEREKKELEGDDAEAAWMDERLQWLNSARESLGIKEFICSSRFRDSEGFYMGIIHEVPEVDEATGLTVSRKRLLVTNPMYGNAQYVVDESKTEVDPDTGRRYPWEHVLVDSQTPKRTARERGAWKNVHHGEWQIRGEEFLRDGTDWRRT